MNYFFYKDDYISHKNFKSASTVRLYKLALNLFERFVRENELDLTTENVDFAYTINAFKDSLYGTYSDASINSFEKVVLNYFHYLQEIDVNINFDINISTTDKNDVTMEQIISHEDFNKMVNYCDNKDDILNEFLLYIAFYTGIKAKYLVKVKYSDFCYEDNKLCYINKIMRANVFTIPLPEKTKELYEKLKTDNYNDNIYIFVNSAKNEYNERYLRKVFQKICEGTGIKSYSPSSFRHSAIYYYIRDNGYSKQDVANFFNWSKDNYDRMYKKLFKNT